MNDAAKPLPTADEDSRGYWEACRKHELQIQHCDACDYYIHFPRPRCPRCGSATLSWKRVSGRGTVYSFVVTHHVVTPGFAPDKPYVVAWVELPEQRALRMLTNIVESPPEAVRLGMPVEVVFEDLTPEISLPQFRFSA